MSCHSLTSPQARQIEKLLKEMSLREKIAQLTGAPLGALMDESGALSEKNMARHLADGIGQITLSAGATLLPPEKTADNANRIQRFLKEDTRLGIPAIFDDECVAGFVSMGATHFPQAIGMGAAWDPDLSGRMAAVIRQQARAAGSHLMYSPVFDVGVDPRWGRTEETWGEDPYLVSRIGVAFVTGLHGGDLRTGVVSTLKHFAGYSSSEGGRNCAPAHMGARELREVFLLPFEAAVKEAGAESVMAAYHEIDGVPCAAGKELLTDILRGEWGFKGIVIADWGVVDMLHATHHVAAGRADAAKLALAAGLDVETPDGVCFSKLVEAVEHGEFSEQVVDEAVRRHLRIKMLLGLFDAPTVDAKKAPKVFDMPEHRAVALEAARASMTLLKNEGNLLPLDKTIKSIAVVGPNADCTHALLGDYSYSVYKKDLNGDAVKIVSVLEGIRSKVSSGTKVCSARGCDVMGFSREGFDEAIRIAKKSDVVIAVMGGRSALHKGGTSGENIDRAELNLPGVQEELLKELHKTGKPLVAVLTNGEPMAIEWMAENVPAILEAWLPGEEGGNAVADVLFGDINPGGKLPVSLLRAAGQAPTPYHMRPSSFADSAHYAFIERKPRFPFGYGLSYTSFKYSNLHISPDRVTGEEEVRISCEVRNAGDLIGDEVVQLYLRDPVASVTRPGKELRGFKRITLHPGQRSRLIFVMPVEMISFYDRNMDRVVEAGEVHVMVGSSSQDIRLEGRFEVVQKRSVGNRTRFRTDVTVEKT